MAVAQRLRLVHTLAQRACLSTSRAEAAKIGFIGLGQMGSRMAGNLDRAGHELVISDMNTQFAEELAAKFSNVRSICNPLN